MPAAAFDDRAAYIHPHLGVASAMGEPFEREVGNKTLVMQSLVADPDPSWSALLEGGLPPLAQVGQVTSMIPVDSLQSGQTSWTPCPKIALHEVVDRVSESPFDLWVDQVSVPWPMKLVERCESELASLARSDDAEGTLADLLVQISDYLSMWHTTSANRDTHSVGQKVSLEALEAAVSGAGSQWSECVGPTYVNKASARELVVILARVIAIVAAGSGVPADRIAKTLDQVFTDRLRSHYDAMVALALAPRGQDANAA